MRNTGTHDGKFAVQQGTMYEKVQARLELYAG